MASRNVVIFWFRRDLRLFDNHGLCRALELCRKEKLLFLPIFIFDPHILKKLNAIDARVTFIAKTVEQLGLDLKKQGHGLQTYFEEPKVVFELLFANHRIAKVFANHDYEPYARKRDLSIGQLTASHGVDFITFKDQVIFEKNEVMTDAGKPYSVFTPYKKKWLKELQAKPMTVYKCDFSQISSALKSPQILQVEDIGFKESQLKFPDVKVSENVLKNYATTRNFPALSEGTSHLGLHLRFGTVSVRDLVKRGQKLSEVWLSELVWREFFMQILWHFPHVEKQSFRPEYDNIKWRNDKSDFNRWKNGETGYPLVDAGIRELLNTGHMHNRVRMVTASFLSKHLLQHWLYGERFFAEHLLDFELAANNGNWQWAAGTGCDAAPYFRVFNPQMQAEKFDADQVYIRKWVPELGTSKYPEPMVEHKLARVRCLQVYNQGLGKTKDVILESEDN